MSRISVCIPCYNNPEELERLLASLAFQRERDFEVCISDDSTDGRIGALVSRWEPRLPLVRYVRNDRPLGHIFNWNAALRMASGAYLKIMFSDDWLAGEDSLARFAEMLDAHPEANLAFSGSRQVMLAADAGSLLHRAEGGGSGHRGTERAFGETDGSPAVPSRDLRARNQDGIEASCGPSGQAARERAEDAAPGVTTPSMMEQLRGFPYYDRHADRTFVRELREDYRRLFLGNQIGAPSAVILRRGPGGNLPLFDEESDWASDVFLYFSVLERNPAFAWTEEPLVCIGVHEGQYTESFSERDERIYQDYRRMYCKHGLWESAACREYMAREFVIPYHKGIEEARALRMPDALYRREWLRMQRETLRSFLGARLRPRRQDRI